MNSLVLVFISLIQQVLLLEDIHSLPGDDGQLYLKDSSKCYLNEKLSNRMKCSNPEDYQTFFTEADFGYVSKRVNSMENICVPRGKLRFSISITVTEILVSFSSLAFQGQEMAF